MLFLCKDKESIRVIYLFYQDVELASVKRDLVHRCQTESLFKKYKMFRYSLFILIDKFHYTKCYKQPLIYKATPFFTLLWQFRIMEGKR